MRTATVANISGVCVKDSFVVSLPIFRKRLHNRRIWFKVVSFEGINDHAHSAVGHDGTFKRRVRLQTDNDFVLAVDVPWGMRGDGTGYLRNVQHALLAFLHEQLLQAFPDFFRPVRWWRQKTMIAFIR